MTLLVSLLASLWLADVPRSLPVVRPAFVQQFEACEYRYTGGQYHDELFRYRMFVPRRLNPAQRYPLLVWLHGKGENGRDNEKNLKWLELILRDPAHLEQYQFFVLVVQCPETGPGWSSRSDPASDMLSVTQAILQQTLRERPIDPDRVYLSGVSAGGTACWEMALRYPEVFAAMVPTASSGGDCCRARQLVQLPIWAFHNAFDQATPPDSVIQMVDTVRQAGGNAHLTLTRSFGHESWMTAFDRYQAMDWMLAQRRGAWVPWTPAGSRPWRWWHVFGVPLAFVLVLGMGWYSEHRRRRRLATPAAECSAETPPPSDKSPDRCTAS